MISMVMIVKNEENNIKKCVESVRKVVDEIIIVDTGSTDNTIEIIEKFPEVKLFHFEWENDFSKARNYSLEKANGDYCLVLDADEFMINGERDELETIMKNGQIGRINIVSDFQKDGQLVQSKSYVTRFFPRSCRFTGTIHEQIISNLPRVEMEFTVGHLGYFNKNKGQRNIPLLIKELEKNPLDSYYLFQLGKEYRIKGDFQQSLVCLIKSLKYIEKKAPFLKELIVEIIYSGKEIEEKFVLYIINKYEEYMADVSDFHFAKGQYYLDYCIRHPNKMGMFINKIESSYKECLLLANKKHIEYVQGTSSYLAAHNLGVFYEVTGDINNARRYYQLAITYNYLPSKVRVEELDALG